MNTLDISLNVAIKTFNQSNTFFTEQGKWVTDKTVTIITMFCAKSIGSEIVVSRCEYEKQAEDNFALIENKCETEDDAIALALNAIV